MLEIWTQFEQWLAQNYVDGLNDLNPPATEDMIRSLEKELNVALPSDFVASLKLHDGQNYRAGGLIDASELLSTQRILVEWRIWKELYDDGCFDKNQADVEDGIKNVWWHPAWIPFTSNGSGDSLCLDLSPTESGKKGQIITLWHDEGERVVIADSFTSWLWDYVSRLELQAYHFSDARDGLVSTI